MFGWIALGIASLTSWLIYDNQRKVPQQKQNHNSSEYIPPYVPTIPAIPPMTPVRGERIRIAASTNTANVSPGTILDIDGGGLATTSVPATLLINPDGTPNSYIATVPSIVTVRWPNNKTSVISVNNPLIDGRGPF